MPICFLKRNRKGVDLDVGGLGGGGGEETIIRVHYMKKVLYEENNLPNFKTLYNYDDHHFMILL